MNQANDNDRGATQNQPPANRRGLGLAILLGGGLALLATALAAVLWLRSSGEHLSRLSAADYQRAVERWDAAGIANYDLDIDLKGNRPSTIHVEVRNGETSHMTRDGVEPSQRRTWDYWTVPGQFDTIGSELEMAKDPAGSFNTPGASQVVQWAEFDPQFGYPRRYRRVVLGANFEVDWTVTRFTSIDADVTAP